MPRKARIDAAGALHHIIVRGMEGRAIFRSDRDREDLLKRLAAILPDTSTACYAWALMPNHFHLLLRTGTVPLATVMRRLLTGYVVTYNKHHNRHGSLFQNRYKSILCQEDLYLRELVRYIHLNPLRGGLVKDLSELGAYRFSGHSALTGKVERKWQDVDFVLRLFGERISSARRQYVEYVHNGISMGRRPELTGGGLIRSLGGWEQIKLLRQGEQRLKGDERILGDSDFVLEVLQESQERLERRYALRSKGVGIEALAERVAKLFGVEKAAILGPGKYRHVVPARSLFCYWAVRELGETATSLARRLGMSQPGVSVAVRRGEEIAKEHDVKILDDSC